MNISPIDALSPIHSSYGGVQSRPADGTAAEVTPAGFDPKSISVVFPAFNEEANIEKAVVAARSALSSRFADIEIIVVDDGSTDRTRDVLDRLAAEYDDVVAVHHAQNRGYGAALRSGLYTARKDLVFFSDSDLQFDLEEIRHLIDWIHDYEIVAGYRVNRADPWNRRFNAWGWNMLVRLVLGLNVRDIDCAFKLFRREVFERVHVSAVGAMINTEILVLAKRMRMRIKEVPVSHYPRVAGSQTGANPKVIIKAFRELFAMYFRLRWSRLAEARKAKATLARETAI
jgi:glycosyltransferase involved in cell wall biosynthesis